MHAEIGMDTETSASGRMLPAVHVRTHRLILSGLRSEASSGQLPVSFFFFRDPRTLVWLVAMPHNVKEIPKNFRYLGDVAMT
ncbi:hypothetical protein D9M69_617520 [compost metagenome]